MERKLLCVFAMLIMVINCAPPGEGGEEGEEKADPCSTDPYSAWLNFFSWGKFCEDGTIGATENPVGKIGKPVEE